MGLASIEDRWMSWSLSKEWIPLGIFGVTWEYIEGAVLFSLYCGYCWFLCNGRVLWRSCFDIRRPGRLGFIDGFRSCMGGSSRRLALPRNVRDVGKLRLRWWLFWRALVEVIALGNVRFLLGGYVIGFFLISLCVCHKLGSLGSIPSSSTTNSWKEQVLQCLS